MISKGGCDVYTIQQARLQARPTHFATPHLGHCPTLVVERTLLQEYTGLRPEHILCGWTCGANL
jgi:hypothetical protein